MSVSTVVISSVGLRNSFERLPERVTAFECAPQAGCRLNPRRRFDLNVFNGAAIRKGCDAVGTAQTLKIEEGVNAERDALAFLKRDEGAQFDDPHARDDENHTASYAVMTRGDELGARFPDSNFWELEKRGASWPASKSP